MNLVVLLVLEVLLMNGTSKQEVTLGKIHLKSGGNKTSPSWML